MDNVKLLELLERTEAQLPDLLRDPDRWRSMFVDYEKPHVYRLWTQVGDDRVYLHKIMPCERGETLYHPHPWPSAVRIVHGRYEMGVGYGQTAPPEAAKMVLTTGAMYAMADPFAWHYVRPLDEPSYSVMLTSSPHITPVEYYENDIPQQRSLTPEEAQHHLRAFRMLYMDDPT